MTIKRKASKVFCKAINRDRPYSYISKNNNKTKNHKQNMRLKHMESGTKILKLSGSKIIFDIATKMDGQIPERVFETVRLAFLTKLNKTFKGISKTNYLYQHIRSPHQILRLKTSVSAQKGISVDRISSGMKNAFGKFYSFAVRIKNKIKNKEVIPSSLIKIYFTEEYAKKENIEKIIIDLHAVLKKMPVKTKVTYKILD